MNDIILMSIKGGRYLEAESQTNQLILREPSSDIYFLMGTIKCNLLFGKNRDLGEALYCFEKAIELSGNTEQVKNDSGAFLFGIYKQIENIEIALYEAKKKKALKSLVGLGVTYFSSKIIDNAESSFGVITGFVGASFGIGMTIEGLTDIGDIDSQLIFVENLKYRLKQHLKSNFPWIDKKYTGKVDINRLKDIITKFPNEFYDFETISNEKTSLTKNKEIFDDLGINDLGALFALRWHHLSNVVVFYDDHIKAIDTGQLFLGYVFVKLDYNDLIDIKVNEKYLNSQNGPAELIFTKGTKYGSKGHGEELENFRLGGKDNLSRDNSLKLKKVKDPGFFKFYDYHDANVYFNSCFECAVFNI